jgi:hypothetical protein
MYIWFIRSLSYVIAGLGLELVVSQALDVFSDAAVAGCQHVGLETTREAGKMLLKCRCWAFYPGPADIGRLVCLSL